MSSVPNLEEGLAPSKALVYTVELEKSFFSRWKLLDWLKKQLSAPLLLCAQVLSERGFQPWPKGGTEEAVSHRSLLHLGTSLTL